MGIAFRHPAQVQRFFFVGERLGECVVLDVRDEQGQLLQKQGDCRKQSGHG
jgi:hypothetical protein